MKNLWIEFEGDNWFLRNKDHLGKNFDIPLFLLELYSIKPKKVLEIGAANGYRLARIYKQYNCDVIGIEPSQRAIQDGKKKYPFIKFFRDTCESFNTHERFDLVIVNFVFHWIYRENLYVCVQKIDELLEINGHLIIGDFGTEYFFKRRYHHLRDANFYTWKMPYWELFTKSGRYLEIAKLRFNHDTYRLSSDINVDNMGTTVLLKKQDLFIER
ncbi:MAG: class I SAM-dependent methyltransferase [Candidatus Aenigmatarchaeota archaeon]|nr:MAG: class I SAM-dependent methyltransferase [Candidatus Aenigmarchaeota archaeon]